MDYADILLTMAEIAVALAGFASLVSVIGRRGDDRSRAVDSFRLRTMLEMALRYAALAILPIPFLDATPSETGVWRGASGLYLVSTALYIALTAKRMRSYAGFGMTADRWVQISTIGLTSISVVINLANVLGLGGSNAGSLYLGALVLGLLNVGLVFLSVTASIFRGPET